MRTAIMMAIYPTHNITPISPYPSFFLVDDALIFSHAVVQDIVFDARHGACTEEPEEESGL